MITNVKLRNWRSHENSEMDFSPGTNGLVGIVGSGKTSILDAICFALFGTFPNLQTRKLKIEDVIMKKPSPKESAEVQVSFMLDNNHYVVKRKIEKNKGTSFSEIRENGKVLESPGTKNVTGIVESKLKVNYELFSKAIYSEQNSIDYFLTIGKGQRMKKIDELLMIDRFEKARANAVKLSNKIVERRSAKQSAIEQLDIDQTSATLEELKTSITRLNEEKTQMRLKMEKTSQQKEAIEKETKELRKAKESIERMMREDKGLESTINATIESTARTEKALKEFGDDYDSTKIIQTLEEQSKKIDELTQALRIKQSSYDDTNSQLVSSRTNIDFLQKDKISRLEREFDEKMKIKLELEAIKAEKGDNVEAELKENKERLQGIISRLEVSKTKTIELEEQMNELSTVEGKCPICDTPLNEEKKSKILSDKKAELDRLNADIERAKKDRITTEEDVFRLEQSAKKIEEMLKQISDMASIKEELDESRGLLSRHISTSKEMGERLEVLKTDLDDMRKKLEKSSSSHQRFLIISQQIRDYEDQKTKIERLRKERDSLQTEMMVQNKLLSGKSLEDRENSLRQLIAQEKEYEMKTCNSDEMIKERLTRLMEYENSLETAKREKSDIQRLERIAVDIKIFAEALKKTQSGLREEFIEAVNFTMNKLWATLYPYQDFIGVRLAIEEGDYVLQLQERTTNWVNVEGVASGGERSIASLALRIAFALVLAPHLRMLVLDEPTANLDNNSVSVLANTLREGISEFIDQCFIITHDETFETAVTGHAYRLQRDKGKDESTKVVSLN